MAIKLNVLGSFMENRIFSNVDCCLVVTFDGNWSNGSDGELIQQPTKP